MRHPLALAACCGLTLSLAGPAAAGPRYAETPTPRPSLSRLVAVENLQPNAGGRYVASRQRAPQSEADLKVNQIDAAGAAAKDVRQLSASWTMSCLQTGQQEAVCQQAALKRAAHSGGLTEAEAKAIGLPEVEGAPPVALVQRSGRPERRRTVEEEFIESGLTETSSD